MYETHHTFALWALAAGESPEWVARTLGHVNTSMIYKTYGRYIPNLSRHDGSAFERQFLENTDKKWDTISHNYGHNGQNYAAAGVEPASENMLLRLPLIHYFLIRRRNLRAIQYPTCFFRLRLTMLSETCEAQMP